MANAVTLTNAGVNSGGALRLLSGNVTYKWESLAHTYPQPGRFTVAPGLMQGWKNPVFNITFAIQMTNPSSSSLITYPQFMEFVRATSNPTYLAITIGDNDTVFSSYASSSSGVSGIPIQITDFSIPMNSDDSANNDLLIINFNAFESPRT